MAQQYGLSFMPGDEQQQGGGGYRAPVQQAVKLLSLRLPSVVGARAIAPQALLEGGGSAAVGGPGGMTGESLVEWLRKLLQQSQGQMPPQAQSVFQPPTAQVPSFSGGGGSSDPRDDGGGRPQQAPAPQPPRRPDVVTPPPAPAPPPASDPGPYTPTIPTPTIIPGEDDRGDEGPRLPDPSPFEPVYPDYKRDLYTEYQSPFDIWS